MVMHIDDLHDKSVAAYKGSYVGLRGFQVSLVYLVLQQCFFLIVHIFDTFNMQHYRN